VLSRERVTGSRLQVFFKHFGTAIVLEPDGDHKFPWAKGRRMMAPTGVVLGYSCIKIRCDADVAASRESLALDEVNVAHAAGRGVA
jgi:hypothetical protein